MKTKLTTKDIQSISLQTLKQITDLCDVLHLRYVLMYGTLLGAVRHQGFIPWDDDVDIMMPRPDYNTLMQYLSENKLPHLSLFNHDVCPDYPYMISRISDDRTVLEMDNEKSIGMGVFIDIYPFDGLGNTKDEAVKNGLRGDVLSSFCYQATRKHFSIENTTSSIKKIAKLPVFLLAQLIGKEYFQKRLKTLENIRDYDSSNYVGCVVWLSGGEKDIFNKNWFDETVLMPFEDFEFKVPKNYDSVLRHIYGQYMQLPPPEDRIGHHYYDAYKL